MDERNWSYLFSTDVDGLLTGAGRLDAEATPAECRQAVDLARTLVTTDFSPESQIRNALRCRLLNQTTAREGWSPRMEISERRSLWRARPVLTVVTATLGVILVAALAWPSAVTGVAQGIETFVAGLVLGPHTSVQQVHPDRADVSSTESRPERPEIGQLGDGWIIRTAVGNFGGNVLPGRDGAIHQFSTFDEAQAAASFRLRQLGYLPSGYELRQAMLAPSGCVFLFYGGPHGDIVLAQTPVGEAQRSEVKHSDGVTVTVNTRVIKVLTDNPTVSVTLNGQPAGWIEDYGLMWEADGATYSLGGIGWTLDEAMRIAESLQ